MAIYKVHIKAEGNKTTYTTNATTFATITRRANFGKFDVTTSDGVQLADTAEEADKLARESITAFFANLGVLPNFINA